MTARETASNVPGLRRISAQTVRNSLRENGLRTRRPYCGAVLRRRKDPMVQHHMGFEPAKVEASQDQ